MMGRCKHNAHLTYCDPRLSNLIAHETSNMKLAETLAVIAPFLATDKTPEAVRTALLAADKKAKDAAGSGLGARELEEKDQAKAQDKRARDAAIKKAHDAMSEKDKEAYDAMSDEDKEAHDAKMCEAEHRDDDPEKTNDEDYTEGAEPTSPGGSRAKGKTTVDSATVDARIKRAVQAERDLNQARADVLPVLGVVTMDSATEVYKAAL